MKANELEQAARVLRRGGIVAYPTESCYGLGCDPRRHAAVRRLLHLKQRRCDKGLILIADRIERLSPYLQPLSREILAKVSTTWPGPSTWLLPVRKPVSRWLRGDHPTLAVRVTAHPGAAALCRYTRGAIVSTSANRGGRPPARSAAAVIHEFGNRIDYVLPGNLGRLKRPTEIRDAQTDAVIRPG